MVHDYCVIGGGIVGLATARELALRRPGAAIMLLEKESGLARHQTGHNSGVIHAGVYYKPNSLKAKLCRAGAAATKSFCVEHGIRFETPGKLIVATNEDELARMEALLANARENSIAIERLDGAELHRREPRIFGLGALYVPESGIVDYTEVCAAMAREIAGAGGEVVLNAAVKAIEETADAVNVIVRGKSYRARHLIVCGGLQSDRLARLANLSIDHQIVPFRGEYYTLRPELSKIVSHLIYPIPDPALPFLGIHLTPMIGGALTVGPNAVISFSREGYAPATFDFRDMLEYGRYSGFWSLAAQNWRSGTDELLSSLSKRRYLKACQKYCPELVLDDLTTRAAGIRAQAVMRDGTLVHDFLFTQTDRMLHVGNAPSPAATSAIPIAAMIVERVLLQQELRGAP